VSTTVYIPRLNVMLQGDRDQSYNQTSPYMVRALALHGLCASAEGSRGEAERAEGTRKLGGLEARPRQRRCRARCRGPRARVPISEKPTNQDRIQ
jgi:hypothetical protein